jgi:hypothetical protein
MHQSSTISRLSSPLANQIEAQTHDQDWVLAHFTFVACVTTLEAECDIVLSPAMSVASYHTFSRITLAFLGKSVELLANYASFLVDPGSEVELLVNEAQSAIAAEAFTILDVKPQWRMIYRGNPRDLDTGHTFELAGNNLPAMQALAHNENIPFRSAARDPFEQGPAFGIWEKRQLVAMSTTILRTTGFAQIGNIIACRGPDRHKRIVHVTSALVKAHTSQNTNVFIIVPQHDEEAIEFFEHLGFAQERPIVRMHCLLKEVA